MLAKEHRIARSTDIQAVIRQGFRVTTSTVIGHVLARPGSGLRFGYIAGKRIGNAVTRNYTKRRFRELTRPLLNSLPDDKAIDIIWRLNQASAVAPLANIERDIAKIWGKALKSESR